LVRVVEGDGASDFDTESVIGRVSVTEKERRGFSDRDRKHNAVAKKSSYRLAILSLSSGWLRPLINLISFAISADMVRENSGRRPDDGTTKFSSLLLPAAVSGEPDCGAVTWAVARTGGRKGTMRSLGEQDLDRRSRGRR
jgi:hypothetical protein